MKKDLMTAAKATLCQYWAGQKSEWTTWLNARDVCRRIGPATDVRTIDESVVDELIADLERDGKAPATINRKLAALSKILRLCYRRGCIERLPLIERLREPRGRIRWVTASEEFKILSDLRAVDRSVMADFVEILLDTGMRTGELLRLEWRDVDFDRRVIRLWNTKNDKPRSVPMTLRAAAALSHQLMDGPYVFTFTQHQFRHVWDAMKKRIGLADDSQFVPHCLRHTCASRLVQRGIDIRIVMEYMGHSNISTTLRYAHLAPENLLKARDALEIEPDVAAA